jgi:Lon protease-like protein
MSEHELAATVRTEGRERGEFVATEEKQRDHSGVGKAVPEDAMIIVPVRNIVAFPGIVQPLTVGRASSIAAVQEAMRTERPIGILLQRDPAVDHPREEDLHWVGTTASILRHVTPQEGGHHLVCQGLHRFRVLQFLEGYPFLVARIAVVEIEEESSSEIEARTMNLKARAAEIFELLPQIPPEVGAAVQSIGSPSRLADLVASLADEFFRRGVSDYIGTAWEVPTVPAREFTRVFYTALHSGKRLGEAVRLAREALHSAQDEFGPVWAAYQHYGDPTREFRFT